MALRAVLVLILAVAACGSDTPAPPDGATAPGGSCPVTCASRPCGSLACQTLCEPGSGCIQCSGHPCGSGFCAFGSGCFCGGLPCAATGCPPGTGCIP